MSFKMDRCTHEAAKYAVENWHYSKSLPTPPYNFIGVWEMNVFIGVVPKRAGSKDIVAKSYQGLEGGENPTSALHEPATKQSTF